MRTSPDHLMLRVSSQMEVQFTSQAVVQLITAQPQVSPATQWVLSSIWFQGKWVGGVDGEVILTLPCTRALFKNADIIYVLNFLLMWWFHMIKLSPEPWCYRNIYSKNLTFFVLEYMWKDFIEIKNYNFLWEERQKFFLWKSWKKKNT